MTGGHARGAIGADMAARTIGEDIASRTDSYFTRTRKIVERFGDKPVVYAVFLRRPVLSAPKLMRDWIEAAAAERGIAIDVSELSPAPSVELPQWMREQSVSRVRHRHGHIA